MVEDSLPKPRALDGAVEIEMRSRHAVVQINRYRWSEARETQFKSEVPLVDLVLSRQAAPLESAYLETGPDRHRSVGDILFMPPEFTLHSRWQAGERRSLCVAFIPNDFDASLDIDWNDSELLASLDVRSAEVRGLLLRLANEVLAPGLACDVLVDALCTAASVEFHRYFRNMPTETAGGGRFSGGQLRRIRDAIEHGIAEVRVSELACEHGMSIRHFSRLFRNSTDRTVSEYVAERRVALAGALLARPDKLIKEIAFACGFQSSSAFAAAFRRATGLTPLQFREAKLEMH